MIVLFMIHTVRVYDMYKKLERTMLIVGKGHALHKHQFSNQIRDSTLKFKYCNIISRYVTTTRDTFRYKGLDRSLNQFLEENDTLTTSELR